MFVLDTNVISELMRESPHSEVLAWLDNQLTSALFVTTITEAEIRTGIALLPEGKRRRGLTAAAERTFGALFSERVLPFDSEAARAYAEIASGRRMAGHPISQADCQIAAITRSQGLSIATRDVNDFEGCGIDVLNPWTDQ
ncbi:MAG: type II toxin-antitoxin system VapC family toxin [Caldilineaceae bacterium]|nr:type II toxin-antitoxin system VapC family toxin [Caldilineaceae bacterium]MDE0464304.1 type II toxin-antitoxin system VapC family toxin [Caldilineaceae bacterium]